MLLAGDVGGTNTRLGLFTPGATRPDLVEARAYQTAAFPTLGAMLLAFLDEVGERRSSLEGAAFGVAGPVVGERIRLTNVDWLVDPRDLALALGLPRVCVLNDLLAMATAVPVLSPGEYVTLQAGTADPRGAVALIAPGTGLGEAFLVHAGGALVAAPSEGGHADFAPRTTREMALLAYLTGRFGRVDYERVISGPGLLNIHQFTHATACPVVDAKAADAAAQVSKSAMEERCPSCTEALDLFVGALGAEAGNMALRAVATGGVFLGGGIPPRILPALQTGRFLDAFRAKPPMADLVARVPVHTIVHSEPALLGAAVAARQALSA